MGALWPNGAHTFVWESHRFCLPLMIQFWGPTLFSGQQYPKNRALKQQSPLIATLPMTASSFLSSTAHSISLFSILPLCTHLSSTLFCPVTIEKKKGTALLGYFSYSQSQTQWHTHTNLFCHVPILIFPSTHCDPTPNAGGYIFILNSFSSSRESTKK